MDIERTIGEGRYCTVSFDIKVSIDSEPYKGITVKYSIFHTQNHRQFDTLCVASYCNLCTKVVLLYQYKDSL